MIASTPGAHESRAVSVRSVCAVALLRDSGVPPVRHRLTRERPNAVQSRVRARMRALAPECVDVAGRHQPIIRPASRTPTDSPGQPRTTLAPGKL